MIELIYGGSAHHFDEIDILIPKKHYETLCIIESDINQHLPTLKRYTQECEKVTEMGVRYGCSTWAFIEGKPKKLTCIDITKVPFEPSEEYIIKMCEKYKIEYNWITGDSLSFEIENTDLLFIDTLHTYNQLSLELRKHESKVSKYIILHDTQLFGHTDEPVYGHASEIIKNMSNQKSGLVPAVSDFISQNKNWSIKEVYQNNNGLTVLQRVI